MAATLVLATRYLTAIGATCFFWDYCLMFNEEKTHIWTRARWTPTHFAFLCKRYTTFLGIIYAALPVFSPRWMITCKVSYVTTTTLAVVATLSSHVCVALWTAVLWDQERWAILALWIVSVISLIGMAVSALITAPELFAHVVYHMPLNMCVVTRNPPAFTGIWTFMLTFDVSTLLLVVANAFHQPYKINSQILDRLKRDAAWTFLVIFAATIIMFTVSEAGPPGSVFETTFLFWAVEAMIECRLAIYTVQVLACPDDHDTKFSMSRFLSMGTGGRPIFEESNI